MNLSPDSTISKSWIVRNELSRERTDKTRDGLIKLSLYKEEDLWKEGARDAKILLAWTYL